MEDSNKKTFSQRYFVTKEIQITIAILVVVALLSGIFLQLISKGLSTYMRIESPFLGIFLTIGYISIIVFLAVVFSYRLVGPFKRLEYEMKLIAKGDLDRRLSIRANDDLHVKEFTGYMNEMINNFEEMSTDYNKVNAVIDKGLDELMEIIASDKNDSSEIKDKIISLQTSIHEFREKW
ncbi:MAG: methyl-accepting chemotaxis protein [Deltaproteobacteria bacterium]|nr:methyl-accepting chemotaxis protein [Deltaproteobacteria bacterium]